MELELDSIGLGDVERLSARPPRYNYPEWVPRPPSSNVVTLEEQASGISHLFRGGSLLAGVIASLPIQVLKRLPMDRGKEPNRDHPAWLRLRKQPNRTWSIYQLVYRSMWDVILYGNWYWHIVRRGSDFNLIRLAPDSVRPPTDEEPNYIWNRPAGKQQQIRPENMVHVTRYTRDGMEGLGLLDIAQGTLGAAVAARESASSFFERGVQTSHAVVEPRPLMGDALKAARREIREEVSGSENNGGFLLLTGGREIKPIGLKPADLQLLEARGFSALEIAAFLGLPIHLIGVDTKTRSFSSLEQEMQSFLSWSINPWLVAIESQLNRKLLTDAQQRFDTDVIEYNREALIRVDSASLSGFISTVTQNGVMTANEVRAKLNLNWHEDGDQLLRQTDSAGGTDEPTEDTVPAEESPRLVAAKTIAVETLRRFCGRINHRLSKLVKQEQNAVAWLENELEIEFGELAEQMVMPALEVLDVDCDLSGIFSAIRSEALKSLDRKSPMALKRLQNTGLVVEKLLDANGTI